jgi:hypothetical protein
MRSIFGSGTHFPFYCKPQECVVCLKKGFLNRKLKNNLNAVQTPGPACVISLSGET